MAERLQKLMARAGIGSRRHNEELIRSGRVQLNGRVARLGDKADPHTDRIEVDGKRLQLQETQTLYIALNKPKGVISSLEDELDQDRTTVRDLIDVPGHLYPVGRLDKQSEGLILMTNDGQLAHKLTHPRYGHKKVYDVILEGEIPTAAVQQWQQGVWLDDKRTAPAQVEVTRRTQGRTYVTVTLREGWKRQIRRVAAALGYPVTKLVRRQIGPLHLGDLPSGQWRYLTAKEVKQLQRSINQTDTPGKRVKDRPPSARTRKRSRGD